MPDLDRKALADEIADIIASKAASRLPKGLAFAALGQLVFENQSSVLAALRDDVGAEMRERAAQHCEARAEYFAAAPCHRDWRDAAHSYRATAKELRALPLHPASETEGEAS